MVILQQKNVKKKQTKNWEKIIEKKFFLCSERLDEFQ